MKLFLSAFENAWAPFYFSEMNQSDAKATFKAVTTYGVAALALMVAGLSALALDLVRLMTTPQFYGAASIVPWIGLSVALQGWYLLTSIGLNITKRTAYYPVATGLAAGASVGLSLLLVPRFGAIGAAWSNTLAYAVLAGAAMLFSQRVYPLAYDWGRLARVIGAAAVVGGGRTAGALARGQPVAGTAGPRDCRRRDLRRAARRVAVLRAARNPAVAVGLGPAAVGRRLAFTDSGRTAIGSRRDAG